MATQTLAQHPSVIHALETLQRCGWTKQEARRLVFARLFLAGNHSASQHPQWPAVYRPLNLEF